MTSAWRCQGAKSYRSAPSQVQAEIDVLTSDGLRFEKTPHDGYF